MSKRAVVPLGLLLLAIFPFQALAAPPIVYADQGPAGGKLFFDPILTWNVAYSEPGYTDCNVPAYIVCHLYGPGQDAKWVRIVIEGRGSASFDLSDEATATDLAYGTCGSAGAFAQCVFKLAIEESSTNFHLQVYHTTGNAGTTIAVYLESGATLAGQML